MDTYIDPFFFVIVKNNNASKTYISWYQSIFFIIFQVSFKLNSVSTISTHDPKMRSKSYSLIFKYCPNKIEIYRIKEFLTRSKIYDMYKLRKGKVPKERIKCVGTNCIIRCIRLSLRCTFLLSAAENNRILF